MQEEGLETENKRARASERSSSSAPRERWRGRHSVNYASGVFLGRPVKWLTKEPQRESSAVHESERERRYFAIAFSIRALAAFEARQVVHYRHRRAFLAAAALED